MKNLKCKVYCFFICLIVWYFPLFGMNPHGIDSSEELSRRVGLRSGEPSRCDHYQNGIFCLGMGGATLCGAHTVPICLLRLALVSGAGCCFERGCSECEKAGLRENILKFFCKE